MMLTSRWNNTNTTRLPLILPSIGDTSQRQQQQETPHRPASNDSVQSIDNAYSLEHLFTALRRRIRRIVQSYNATSFYHALKICARIFRSYASFNLNTIDEFARRLNKSGRDSKQVLTFIDQFRLQLSELRHCHSTFEAELLVTTLAIDFHENDTEQQQTDLPLSKGKFSPRSRLSKFLLHHTRQATELKSQLKQANEHLQILLFDEFNANITHLWDESDKYVSGSMPFHDPHMTYVLRLIPDIALKFEYALQLCTKLFDLEITMLENNPQTTNKNLNETTPVMMMSFTPRSDYNQQQQQQQQQQEIPQQYNHHKIKSNKKPQQQQQSSTFFSADITSASSVSSTTKVSNTNASPRSGMRREEPLDILDQHEHPIFPPLISSSEKAMNLKNDQTKLRLLIEQLEKRSIDEDAYRKRLLRCVKQASKKSEQLNRFPRTNMLTLVMSDEPAVVEYQKALCRSDYQIHKSVVDELNIAIKETQNRIDWINMVRTRALQCLG